MKLVWVRLDGFGKLAGCTIAFDPHVTIVYGPNEAGKSTLSSALLALLYGLGRTRNDDRERWRPWNGDRFGGSVFYELADGQRFEVQRDFDRETRAVRIYDENGVDRSGDVAVGKVPAPGHAHLGIAREVFVNASYVAQGELRIDGARAERISGALAHALDGGPREDAALGALGRLDEALAAYVGTKRATVNVPLRDLRDEIEDAETQAADMRARLARLDDLRTRAAANALRAEQLSAALAELERRGRALRAQTLAARLDRLHELREEVAELHRQRATYDDVADFPTAEAARLERLFQDWRTADTAASEAARAEAENAMSATERVQLDELLSEGGAVGEARFAALEEDARTAHEARTKATFAANEVQSARRAIDGGNELFGAAFALAALAAAGAVVLGVLHFALTAVAMTVLAVLLGAFAGSRFARRRASEQRVARMQKLADDAAAVEARAAAALAAALAPLGAPSIEELARRRSRAETLLAKREAADKTAARARETRRASEEAARAFDTLARRLGSATGSRRGDLTAAQERAARRTARDGIDAQLSMFELRRADALGDEDEFALEAELDELRAAGVVPATGETVSQRVFDAERADLERRRNESREAAAAEAAELRALEGEAGDLAALDERVARLREREARLERFAAAVGLARKVIDERTREAHQKFARRLADYASQTLAEVTGGRYGEVFVDPTTLEIRVRVPETRAIESIDRLSTGTREQAYLVVRLAMARMFAEGAETPPLILDDPFAFWDEARVARSFPVLEAATRDAQAILFTSSRQLTDAALARGTAVVDLTRLAETDQVAAAR